MDNTGTNNGVLEGGVSYAAGEVGEAFSFNGMAQYVKVPKTPSLDVGNQLTIEFWMKPDASNAMDSYQGLVTSDFYLVEISNGYGSPQMGVNFVISTDSGATISPYSFPDTADANGGGAPVTAGQWHHIAATYDGTKMQLYVDGAPWGNPAYHSGAISPMLANSFVTIGGEDGRNTWKQYIGPRYFNGLIDEPTIYNRALSASEILAIYNAGSAGKCTQPTPPVCTPAPSGLVSWWRAEDNALDSTGTNNGVLEGGAAFAAGEVGQAFSFNGMTQYVKVPKTPSLDVGNQLTIEFWMKADPSNAMDSYQGLVTSDFYAVEISNGYGSPQMGVNFFISTDGGASISPYSFPDTADANGGGAPVTAGQWHHIAATYDGTKLQLYVDGTAWGSPAYHSGAISPMLANSFVTIGGEDGRNTWKQYIGPRYFNGLIDEPTIYNRALNASEILAIYNAGSAGKCQLPPVADATATKPLVISVNGTNATVVLDGSRSYDPDGESLQYSWFLNGSTSPAAAGVVAVVTLPVGTNSITLQVSDGAASASQTISVEVITISEAVDRLADIVSTDISKAQPFIASLNAALESIERSNPNAAINQLQAFQNKVVALISPLDPILAQSLIDQAQAIIDALVSAGGGAPGKVSAMARNGKMHLHFPAMQGQIYLIEASTDLVNWVKIGVATDLNDGTFQYDDVNIGGVPARFYRVVTP